MASIRFLRHRRRWQVRWHITDPTTKKIESGSKLLPAGCNRYDAEALADKYKAMSKKIKLGRYHPPEQIAVALERWKAHIRRHTDRTQKHYLFVMERFLNSLPKYVHNTNQIVSLHIDDYISGMLSAGQINRTCNAHLTAIKSFCRWLSETSPTENPAGSVKNLKEDPPHQRFLSPVEYKAVIANAAEPYRSRLVFLSNTGLRASEFSGLTWRCVSHDLMSLTVLGKGRKLRTIPLNPACRQILLGLHTPNTQTNDSICLLYTSPSPRDRS